METDGFPGDPCGDSGREWATDGGPMWRRGYSHTHVLAAPPVHGASSPAADSVETGMSTGIDVGRAATVIGADSSEFRQLRQ